MKNTISSLILISAAAFLCGCQNAKQHYQIVSVSNLLPTIDKRFQPILMNYEKLRKVSLATWECYVPDDKPEETFFCADKGEIAVFISGIEKPATSSFNSEDHTHTDAEEHTHHD